MFDDFRLFYSEFRQNFTTTGAIAPSSPLLSRAMTRPLMNRGPSSIRVLEIGPGTGAFTSQILRHLRSGDRFDAYELNSRFCRFLRRSLPLSELTANGIDCRLYNSDIRTVPQDTEYDYMICGLPFNNFRPETVSEILHTLIQHLSPNGVLSYFEYIFSQEFKSRFLKPSERERMLQVGLTVRTFIQKHQFHHQHVWLNFPPAKARYFRRVVGH